MKRYAIIGSSGYLGAHTSWYLKKKQSIIECYDNIASRESYYIDLTQKETLDRIDFNVDIIFLFAGITGTNISFEHYENFINVNEIGLLNLLDSIRKSPYRPKIVFPSTRLIYKGNNFPLQEQDAKDCKSIYALNKLTCENILKIYSDIYEIPYSIFRICVPYGNYLNENYSFGTIGSFIKMATTKKEIVLYGDGQIKRTFTNIQDVCFQIVQSSLENESTNETFNVGGETFTLKDVAEIIADKYNSKIVHISWPEKDYKIESGHTFFSDDKIQKLIGPFEYLSLLDYSF